MKAWQQGLMALLVMGFVITLLITQSRRETPYSRRYDRLYIQPFVDAQIDGVVVEIRNKSFDSDHLPYWSNAKEFIYRDRLTQDLFRFDVGWGEPLQVGDTIRKQAGQNAFTLYRTNGTVYRSNAIRRR